jgi:Transposase IS4
VYLFNVTVSYVYVDESLVSFRGRCPLRVYMPNKPAKYGIQVWALCDVGTSFAGNMQVYLGKSSDGATEKA